MPPNESSVSERVLSALEGQYLSFTLGSEVFGLPILSVQEIIGLMPVTRVPRTPDYVRGVINLRGKVIPVIDLRLKFGMKNEGDTPRTCIIVVQVKYDSQTIVMGFIVDEVSEVLEIGAEQIEPPPAFGDAVAVEFIVGMGKVGQKVIMLLDVARILSATELAETRQLSKETMV